MGGSMSQIMPGVYIGSYGNASNETQLDEAGITHVLAVHNLSEEAHRRHSKQRVHKRINISDVNTEMIAQYFPECNDFIHEARLSGGRCLIHCQVGISRSVSVTCAYVMSVTTLFFNDTLTAVQGARPLANPNNGFRAQLMDFERRGLSGERKRLRDKYGPSAFLEADTRALEANTQARLSPSPAPVAGPLAPCSDKLT